MKIKAKVRQLLLKAANGVEREEFGALKATLEKSSATHAEYAAHEQHGRELAHDANGEGVANLIREILSTAVQEEIGDQWRPVGGASRADVMETDAAIDEFAESVASEIRTFVLGIRERNAVRVKWGRRVKCGVNVMMSLARGKGLLASFARIWAKEHKDERQKDVLTPGQIKEWKGFGRRLQIAINAAVGARLDFWELPTAKKDRKAFERERTEAQRTWEDEMAEEYATTQRNRALGYE